MAPHATSRKGAKTQKKDHNKVKIDNLLENFMVLLKEQQLLTPRFSYSNLKFVHLNIIRSRISRLNPAHITA